MPWTIVEQFVETKIDGRACEDIIVASDSFVAVIDGASDATGASFGTRTGGRLAADTIASTIETLHRDVTAREFADQVTSALADAVRREVGELDGSKRWPAACVACVSFEREEIWRIGDCGFVLDGVRNIGTLSVDEANYRFRAAINAALMESGTPLDDILRDDPGAKAARGLIDIQQHLANTTGPWAYGCVNGRTVPDRFVEVFSMHGDSEIIMATDGYPVLERTLQESEDQLHAMLARDPAAIGELRKMSKSLRPGANSMDDRAYVRLKRTL